MMLTLTAPLGRVNNYLHLIANSTIFMQVPRRKKAPGQCWLTRGKGRKDVASLDYFLLFLAKCAAK